MIGRTLIAQALYVVFGSIIGVAYHEAAHAVVGATLGFEIITASIEPDEGAYGPRAGHVDFCGLINTEEHAMLVMAGHVCTELLGISVGGDSGATVDTKMWTEIIAGLVGPARDESRNLLQEGLIRETKRLIKRKMPQIQRLAIRLLLAKSLEGSALVLS